MPGPCTALRSVGARGFAAVSAVVFLLAAGLAAAKGPSEMFLEAWQLREDGMKSEQAGGFKTAYDQYRAAAKIYDQIAREHPDWKPAMVEFRRNGMREQINGVAEKAAKEGLGRPANDPRPLPPGAALPVEGAPPAGGGAVVVRPPAPPQPVDDPFARLRIQELERQQAGARQTLEALARERDALKTRLAELENLRNLSAYEARKFREERDKAKQELADLQEKGINSGVAERARATELEKKLADMESKIADAAKLAKAQGREQGRAEGINEGLARGKEEVEKQNARLARELARIEAELASTRRDTKAFEETIRVLTAERDRWKTERDQLAAMVRQKDGEPALIATTQRLEKELAEARQKLVELAAEKDKSAVPLATTRRLEKELAEARQKLVELAAEKEKPAVPLATTQRLENELAEAREKISKLSEEQEKNVVLIAGLKDRLLQVEGELGAARKENAQFRDRMSLLEKQLSEAKAALEAVPPPADPLLAEENRTLREIVVRQLRQQVYRARARGLLLSELAKLEINSKALIRYIDQLEGKGSEPTPEEVARIQDHEIRALSGVELSGKFFGGDALENPAEEPAADPEPPESTPEIVANETPAPPVETRPDAAASFDAQKRSLATTAESAFRRGDFQEAEETYRLIVEADPSDVRMMCNLGVSLIKQEKFGDAIPKFQEALTREEANPFAHLMLGVCHWKLRQPELAVDRLNRSLVLQPANPQAWLYLGLVALDANRFRDAQTAFAKAIEIKPDYALAHYNLAVVHTKPGSADPVQAKRSYEESLRHGGARDEAIELFLRLGTEPEPVLPDAFDGGGLPALDDPVLPPPPGPELPPGIEEEELPRL
jgi:Flp pilus assembly protein TadD